MHHATEHPYISIVKTHTPYITHQYILKHRYTKCSKTHTPASQDPYLLILKVQCPVCPTGQGKRSVK